MDPGKRQPARAALDERSLAREARRLAAADPRLARILERWGTPPLWRREPGFATLVHMILEQQVSLASARAAMDALVAEIGPPAPRRLLALDDAALLRIGFSRQKRRYARELAARVLDGRLDFEALDGLSDSDARGRLMEVPGIGRWTADVYLLMALGRPDLWPVGDRALVVAARALHGLEADPDAEALEALAAPWRPWRSVAARMLWHYYLSELRPGREALVGGRTRAPGSGSAT